MNNKIEYKNNIQIVTKENKKYIKLKGDNTKEELYDYLSSKNFNNFFKPIEKTKDYKLYPFIENRTQDKEERANELINIMSELHNKTTSYKEINKLQIKKIYTNQKENLSSIRNYYFEIQDYFETKEFPSPEEQLLLNNISNIYKAINYSEFKIDSWYEKINKKNQCRYVQLHNNLSLDNLLLDKNYYLINWNNSEQNLPIYDFINLYKKEFNNLDMKKLFSNYQRKYKYSEEEQLLFESLLSIPPKIIFNKSHLINTIKTRQHLNYIELTSEFLKNDKENQENNK